MQIIILCIAFVINQSSSSQYHNQIKLLPHAMSNEEKGRSSEIICFFQLYMSPFYIECDRIYKPDQLIIPSRVNIFFQLCFWQASWAEQVSFESPEQKCNQQQHLGKEFGKYKLLQQALINSRVVQGNWITPYYV